MSAKNIAMAAAGSSAAPTYVDDVFSAYAYVGTGSSLTINNGIDLSGKGGMVWVRDKNSVADNYLFDTARGVSGGPIASNFVGAEKFNGFNEITSFNSNGFSLPADGVTNVNANFQNYISWTFRKQTKFFDVVTYTGNGSVSQTLNHSLGSVPGCIFVKRRNANGDWTVYHRSLPAGNYLRLNTTVSQIGSADMFPTAPTASQFTVGRRTGDSDDQNANTGTYVAYLFAHDTATDGLIQCGSFSGNTTVDLGWEPQFVITKISNLSDNWRIIDSLRSWTGTSAQTLLANSTTSETSSSSSVKLNSRGFSITNNGGNDTIYIAIRRPNKPPTSGTQVFFPNAATPVADAQVTTGFPVDLQMFAARTGSSFNFYTIDRSRGYTLSSAATTTGPWLSTSATSAEQTANAQGWTAALTYDWWNTGFKYGSQSTGLGSSVFYALRRAPGFFDVVCYTGTGVARTVSHNLGAVPELMIIKSRGTARNWIVYHPSQTASKSGSLNGNAGWSSSNTDFNSTDPISTVFTVGTDLSTNGSGTNYVAYLFASLPGISKVGSYTGNGGTVNTNGTSQTINCGFAAGARFVLIKRTDGTGDWFVFDTARGVIAANDPYLLLNSTAAEVTTVDAVDPDNSGFIVNQTSGTNLNFTNATYIYLAIA